MKLKNKSLKEKKKAEGLILNNKSAPNVHNIITMLVQSKKKGKHSSAPWCLMVYKYC